MAIKIKEDIAQKLSELYLNPRSEGSFGGVERLFRAAKNSGLKNISRNEIKQFLQETDPYTLHRPARRRFPTRKTITAGIDYQWQADLVDMTELARDNKGYRYILTVIDCFSRYAWAIPVKRKDAINIQGALSHLLDNVAYPRIPRKLHTDKGREFLNTLVQKLLRDRGIEHFYTHSTTKASIVERFNRTLKQRMWAYFTAKNTRIYLDVLDQFLVSYNKSVHRSIGVAPEKINKRNEKKIWNRLYSQYFASGMTKRAPEIKSKQARISKQKTIFEKGYLPNWSKEIFNVERSSKGPGRQVYKLRDMAGENIQGIFYPEEVQFISRKSDADLFRIERVLRKRRSPTTGAQELLVKWDGWPEKFNSWILETDIHRATK